MSNYTFGLPHRTANALAAGELAAMTQNPENWTRTMNLPGTGSPAGYGGDSTDGAHYATASASSVAVPEAAHRRRPEVGPLDPPIAPATFNFAVSSLKVKNPRSLFKDSDYATLSINALAADNTVITRYGPVSRSLGDLGKGAMKDPMMSLTGLSVPDGGSLAVSFVVVNKGAWSWDADVINALELAGSAVLGALAQGAIVAPATTKGVAGVGEGVTTVTTATVTLGEAIGVVAAIIGVLEGINILFADCDGTVVPGTLSLGQTELLQYAATGAWNIIVDYPGTDSPYGCGANSDYSVTYSVEATTALVAVPDIIGKSPGAARALAMAAGLVYSEVDARIGPPKSAANVTGQTPPAGTLVMSGSGLEATVELPTAKGHPQP